MTTLPPRVVVPPPGPRSREIARRLSEVECPAFDARRGAREARAEASQAPIAYLRAHGGNVEDADGNRYVDLVAGFGACVMGHAPAAVKARVERQMADLWLALGDVYASEVKAELCERLARLHPAPGARVMLGTSGADAVTSALKTCALATGKAGVVAFEGAYHGLSHGPLAACGLHPGFREPFRGQLGEYVVFAPYPRAEAELDACMAHVSRAMERGGIGAVLVEPVLGRGGCVVPPRGFLARVGEVARAHGAFVIADEIWTGMGRSGSVVASLEEMVPDVICLGKGLGGGFPVSACVGSAEAMRAWGEHGGTAIHTATHFGNPIGCAAAMAVMDEVEGLAARAREVGGSFGERLGRVLGDGFEVGGVGLMIGVRRVAGAGERWALETARRLLGEGYLVLTGGVDGGTITLTPPLNIEEGALEAFGDVLARVAA